MGKRNEKLVEQKKVQHRRSFLFSVFAVSFFSSRSVCRLAPCHKLSWSRARYIRLFPLVSLLFLFTLLMSFLLRFLLSLSLAATRDPTDANNIQHNIIALHSRFSLARLCIMLGLLTSTSSYGRAHQLSAFHVYACRRRLFSM